MTRRCLVDTNLIVRYLQGQPESQAAAATRLLERAAEGELTVVVHPAVIAEVVYVGCSQYGLGFDRRRVAEVLREFLTLPGVEVADLSLSLDALTRFADTSLDYVDALLLAQAGRMTVYSFDQAMLRAGAKATPMWPAPLHAAS